MGDIAGFTIKTFPNFLKSDGTAVQGYIPGDTTNN
jgi:hypothetical protein